MKGTLLPALLAVLLALPLVVGLSFLSPTRQAGVAINPFLSKSSGLLAQNPEPSASAPADVQAIGSVSANSGLPLQLLEVFGSSVVLGTALAIASRKG